MNTIIFLDIDGPMVPAGMFLIAANASYEREMSPIAVAAVNHLCAGAETKIVTNSTHNFYYRQDPKIGQVTLRDDLVRNGIREHNIHADWRTDFNVGDGACRLDAIHGWLQVHQEEGISDWIVFDDDEHLASLTDRCIHIDFDKGICARELNLAATKLGFCEKRLRLYNLDD